MQSMDACIAGSYTNPDFTQADIAEAMCLSSAHLSKLYKKERGATLAEGMHSCVRARWPSPAYPMMWRGMWAIQ